MKRFTKYLVIVNLILTFSILGQVYKVDDFGAIGDGVTDDHDAIQDALGNLKSTGGELQFTSGKIYLITNGLEMSYVSSDHEYLITSTEEGKATIKIADGTLVTYGYWGLRLQSSPNVTISNLHIDANRDNREPAETSGVHSLLISNNCEGMRLYDLLLDNAVCDNLYFVSTKDTDPDEVLTDFEMHNCVLENAYRNNMSVINGYNFKIIGCEFNNAHGTAPEGGIDFEPNGNDSLGYGNMLVEGCTFKNNHQYGLYLTYIIPESGSSIVKNNVFDNNALMVVSKYNVVKNNIFMNLDHWPTFGNEQSERDGIVYFHGGNLAEYNKFYNNYFYNNPTPSDMHIFGFLSTSGKHNEVFNNYEYNTNVEGFVSDSDGQVVYGNTSLNNIETGYWNFDADFVSGTTVSDLSDFAQTGTMYGNPVKIQGKINEALDFSPDNKYIEIPIKKNLNIEMNITISAWVKWNGTNGETEQVIVGRDNDWRFGVDNSGKVGFYAPKSNDNSYIAGWTKSETAISTGAWTFVTLTYNGIDTKIYINGEEDSSERGYGRLDTTSTKIYIASLVDDDKSFNGSIDDVKLYNYALTGEEIRALYNEHSEETEEIVGQWDFEDPNDLGKATVGADLQLLGSPTPTAGASNQDNKSIKVINGNYLKAITNFAPIFPNTRVNTYTLSWDIKMDELGWNSLLHTYFDDHPEYDGQMFVKSNGAVGKGCYSNSGVIVAGQWHRIIQATKKENPDSVSIKYYVDGTQVKLCNAGVDSRFSLGSSFHLFVDDGDEEMPTDVAQVVLYNYALTSAEVAALGTVPTPVELTSFTATASNDAVVLNWETATEVNNYGFEVESKRASTDEWSKIGFVSGHGNSNSPNSYSYTATDGAKYYRLKQVDIDGAFEYSDVVTVSVNGLAKTELYQNYPNPFNPTTIINFRLRTEGMTKLVVYNILGQQVKVLLNENMQAGSYSVPFVASNLTSGVYYYKLQSNNKMEIKKMLLIK